MAFDPELVAETRAWAFHCQQAAEKALKGFLTWNGCTFRKTQNLEEIGEQCLAVDRAGVAVPELPEWTVAGVVAGVDSLKRAARVFRKVDGALCCF
ncbi:MAG: HEPN domain-containing protein [Bryobacteraceae bacterium]